MSTLWIAAAIVVIIVLRRWNPVAGSAFGVAASLAVAVWGYWAYSQGGGMGLVFSNRTLPQTAFYAIVGVWFGIEVFGLIRNLRRRADSPATED